MAVHLLRLCLGRAQAAQAEPSLAELFALRAGRTSRRSARLWYWRQVAGFVLRRRLLASARSEARAAALHRSVQGDHRHAAALHAGAWIRDTRLAVRSLLRRPAFTALAVATLALGIGANTAIFSVLYGSLLRALPYAEPERLVWLSDGHVNFGGAGANQSVPNLMDLQAGSQRMSSMVIYKVRSGNLSTAERPERIAILYASAGLLTTLGMPLQLGRDVASLDDEFGSEPVAILTDRLWRSRFGGDPTIVGQTTLVDARPTRIIGVAPANFLFPEEPQLVMSLQHVSAPLSRGNRGHWGLARLAPGADVDALRQELAGIWAGLVEEYPRANEGWFPWAQPLRDYVVARNQRSLLLMTGAAALVLLIACVNVANLMLVRAETRQREFAVRYSIGATRAALVPLFLSEGLVIALAGGAIGIAVARSGVDVLLALYGGTLARADEIALSWPVLGLGIAVSTAIGVIVGLLPLLRSRPGAVHETLKDGGRGSAARGSRAGRLLVVTEVALAVLIVAAAGLLANSMWRLQAIDLGVDSPERVLTFTVSLPTARYRDATAVQDFFDTFGDRLARLPGTAAVGLVNRLPLLGGDNTSVSAFEEPETVANFASSRMVTAGYFEATGVTLVAGRLLGDREFVDGDRAIVVNQTLARKLFGTESAVGRRVNDPMRRPGSPGFASEGLEIVGVIVDIVGGRPAQPAPAAFYYAFKVALDMLARQPDLVATEQIAMSGLLRSVGEPGVLIPDVTAVLAEIDPEIPLFAVQTLKDIAFDRLGTRRFAVSLFGVFAGLALLLGAVGIYGVMSYGVARRSRELGVRMALGADRLAVLRLVLGEAARLTGPGLGIGLLLAFASTSLLNTMLYGVSAIDPPTYLAVMVVLAMVCLGAAYVPALRATRVDPVTSMRSD